MTATRQLFAAAALSLVAVGSAFAGNYPSYESPAYNVASVRSRDAVVAEVQNLRAQGALKNVGDTAEAPAVAVVPNKALTREAVLAEVAAAQAAKTLPRNGEL